MSERTLLDIKSDYIFKLIFGEEKNKNLLISLLNSILKGNPTVTNLEIRNAELSKILKKNLTMHLDIKAEIGFQQFVNIEMQVRNTGEIVERAVQYLAEILARNARKLTKEEEASGKIQTYRDPKVIGIWIMGENITDRADAVNEASLTFPRTERDEYQIITDKLRIFFIELPKFHPKHVDRKNMLDVWMAFLNNPLNGEIQDIDEVQHALDALKEVSEDEEVRETYFARKQAEFGYLSEKNVAVQKALKEGKEEGEKIGLEKGKAEGEKIGAERERAKAEEEKKALTAKAEEEKKQLQVKSAKKMLSKGLDISDVADFTGLSIEEVEKLAEK